AGASPYSPARSKNFSTGIFRSATSYVRTVPASNRPLVRASTSCSDMPFRMRAARSRNPSSLLYASVSNVSSRYLSCVELPGIEPGPVQAFRTLGNRSAPGCRACPCATRPAFLLEALGRDPGQQRPDLGLPVPAVPAQRPDASELPGLGPPGHRLRVHPEHLGDL